jgi:MSHA biogenesis protein MshP
MSGRLQQGFSLVTAIFILVVLAMLMTYMLNLNVVQHSTVVLNVQGARAMQAARSGLEYGVYQALSGASCSPGSDTVETLAFASTETALKSFSVTVNCTASPHTEATTTLIFYTITALAENAAYAMGADVNPDYISRRLRVTVSNAPP